MTTEMTNLSTIVDSYLPQLPESASKGLESCEQGMEFYYFLLNIAATAYAAGFVDAQKEK